MSGHQYGGHAGPSTANIQEPTFREELALLKQEQSYLHQEQADALATLYHHGRNMSASSSKAHQQATPPRGRTAHRQPDIMWNDPAAKTDQSDMTTMSDVINMGNPRESAARSMSRHKSPPKPATTMPPKPRPEPLNLADARRYAALVGTHMNIHPVHHPISPQKAEHRQVLDDGTSSIYDATPLGPRDGPAGSPQHVPHNPEMAGVNILKRYSEWRYTTDAANAVAANAAANDYSLSKSSPERRNTIATPREAVRTFGMSKSNGAMPQPSSAMLQPSPAWDPNMPPFTPLTPFIMGGHVRKASKTLIGENGWLEDTAERTVKKPERQKNTGFFGNVKKTARKIAEMTEFKPSAPKTRAAKEITISLDPREQSLLYCELQFLLSNSLCAYADAQFYSGRLDHHILAKVSDTWKQQGRPSVIGYRYDLETQIDLVTAHVGTFRFYGPDQTDTVLIKALLYDMKMNARAMRIVTYCQPDSVIAKHILDSQRLLQLLDSPESMQISLEEVSQFLKVGIERENAKRIEKEMGKTFVAPTQTAATPQAEPTPAKSSHAAPTPAAPTQDRPAPVGTVNSNTKRMEQFSIPSPDDFPGGHRVKNQASLPESQRHFSGPVLEPKTYDPPKSQRKKQDDQRRPPGY
ncbi:hypothetical protein GGR53DRAFT_183271 [Hypoxylon sp. FL1150]|nr:hypothetical protein GGR53DRAFT_183271 [Hypoxylon sp. FL1150]